MGRTITVNGREFHKSILGWVADGYIVSRNDTKFSAKWLCHIYVKGMGRGSLVGKGKTMKSAVMDATQKWVCNTCGAVRYWEEGRYGKPSEGDAHHNCEKLGTWRKSNE